MSKPLWTSDDKKNKKKSIKEIKNFRKMQVAKYCVEYSLTYDNGTSEWTGYYRTLWGAKISAWSHVHIRSWGGTAEAYPYPKPKEGSGRDSLTPGNKLTGAHVEKKRSFWSTALYILKAVGAILLLTLGILFGYYKTR